MTSEDLYTGAVDLSLFPVERHPTPAKKIRPLTGQVLIELLPVETKSLGGIDLPQRSLSAEEVQDRHKKPEKPPGIIGIVRECGNWPRLPNGMMLMPEFGKGAKVVIRPEVGLQMQRHWGERFRMVRQSDVLAVLGA